MIDWDAIRSDYEDGISLRTLSTKYTVPKTTIIRHQQAEGWERTADRTISRTPDRPPMTKVVGLADSMIDQLAVISKIPLDLKEHKLFADALSQYNKILVSDPTAQQDEAHGPVPAELLPFVDEKDLAAIDAILSRAQERKMEAEQKITPIRREA